MSAESPVQSSPATPPPLPQQAAAQAPTAAPLPRWKRVLWFPVKLVLGMFACQSLIGGIAVLGWTYRLMQRVALHSWWRRSQMANKGVTFAQFTAGDFRTRPHQGWPNWILATDFREAVKRPPGIGSMDQLVIVLKALIDGLWQNLKIGIRGIANIWVLTLPGCMMMWFGWYDGWQNSFNKGYETYSVGLLISWVGIAAFIAAMFYVPMAAARQAVTGDWRSFYQFKFVWNLIRQRWLGSVGLAVLYSAVTAPAMVLKTYAYQNLAGAESLSPKQVESILDAHFIWSALWVLPAFVLVRWVAARLYAGAILNGVQTGAIGQESLGEIEWQSLHRLGLLHVQPQPSRHILVAVVAWFGTRVGRITARFIVGFVWLSLVAEIYISEFFNYHPAIGWMNQPIVQLPWFNYQPPSVQSPLTQPLGFALALLILWTARRILRAIRNAGARFSSAP